MRCQQAEPSGLLLAAQARLYCSMRSAATNSVSACRAVDLPGLCGFAWSCCHLWGLFFKRHVFGEVQTLPIGQVACVGI